MLKTKVDDAIWLVHQPDHAHVSGYLAAHWGGSNAFTRPGHYPGSTHSDVWRQEVVLAIAEHDNGWWEWEASPTVDLHDGLPLDFSDVGWDHMTDGFQRWRLGVPRLAARHPYAALLISLHPYWLYAFAFDDIVCTDDDPFRHALFGTVEDAKNMVTDHDSTRKLLDELKSMQQELKTRLRAQPEWAGAIGAAHVNPHFKLLQITDAMSLLLSMNARRERQFTDVPRRGWADRVTLTWRPLQSRRIVCEPWPFDTDPLEVHLPVRVITGDMRGPHSAALSLTRLQGTPLRTIRFELCSLAYAEETQTPA